MENFYKKYFLGIKKFVSRKIDDENVVEELTNDILMAGMSSLSTFNGKSSEFSWLCSIAKHKIIDYYRKKKLKTILFSAMPSFEEIADQALTPERDCLKNELKSEIEKTFQELKEDYKKIIRLKYVDGLKVQEIAKIFKTSIKATESILIRAKTKFRQNWNYDKKKD